MVRVLFLLQLISAGLFADQRLVTLSPALTELVFQLGLGNTIVGVSSYSDFPTAAKNLPRVGELFFPSLERILPTNPTWILNDAFTENSQFLSAAGSLGLQYKTFRIDSVDALFRESETILQLSPGASASEKLDHAKMDFKKWLGNPKPFSFLFFTWANPPILASSTTFFSNLFERKGGKNLIPASMRSPYLQVSQEWLIQQKPQVIFCLRNSDETFKEVQDAAKRWWGKTSVKVIGLNPEYFARTSLSPIFALKEVEDQL